MEVCEKPLLSESMDPKLDIIERFLKNVKGQQIDISKYNQTHDGKEGHWLEERMGIKANNTNAPDIFGYEMKKTAPVISFGDWSATEYLFSKKKKILPDIKMTRKEFLGYFGKPNSEKNGRLSWSGKCFPIVDTYNEYGQKLVINEKSGDITIVYSTSHDTRQDKPTFEVLEFPIAFWDGDKLKARVSRKFGQNGFFICKKKGEIYHKICFGGPLTFEFFIQKMCSGYIYIDSGMYDGNSRNYSQFRATKKLWDQLITEEYE